MNAPNKSGWKPEMVVSEDGMHRGGSGATATTTGNRALMLPDGIHPNAQGVERMADRIAPLVAERLD